MPAPRWIALACLVAVAFGWLPAPQARAAERVVGAGAKVSVEYSVTLEDGRPVESTRGKPPLVYTQGKGEVLPALERALVGLRPGESRKFQLTPEEGYGPVKADARRTVPWDSVPAPSRRVGAVLRGVAPNGEPQVVRVHAVDEDKQELVLDLNHPLAGKTLLYDVTILSVE